MKKGLPLSRSTYADVVPTALSDIEIARMWRALGATVPAAPPRRRPSRPPVLLGLLVAVLAAVAAFFVVLMLAPASDGGTPALAAFEGPPGDPRPFWELPNGSRVTPAPDGSVRLLHASPIEVELLLLGGAVEVSVAPGSRRLALSVAGFELVARGGRFRAALAGEFPDRRVEVTVHEGQLEVVQMHARGPAQVTLGAGQSWSSDPLGSALPIE